MKFFNALVQGVALAAICTSIYVVATTIHAEAQACYSIIR